MRPLIFSAAASYPPTFAFCAVLGTQSLDVGQQPYALSAAAASTVAMAGLFNRCTYSIDRK
jgi:hypothetical protein